MEKASQESQINVNDNDIVNFDHIFPRISEKLRNVKFIQLPLFREKHVDDSIFEFVSEFNCYDVEKSLKESPKIISEFIMYLHSLIPVKSCFPVASHWPPVVPQTTETMELVIDLFLEVSRMCEYPQKFFRFISLHMFPLFWNKASSNSTNSVIAFSLCKVGNKKKMKWAVVTQDAVFHLYGLVKEKIVVEKEGKLNSVQVSQNLAIQVFIIEDQSQRILCEFTPVDSSHVDYWGRIFEKSRVPFINYLSCLSLPVPAPLYGALYSTITNNDMAFVKSLLSNEVCHPSSPNSKQLMKALFEIFKYAQKSNILYSMVLSIFFSDSNKSMLQIINEPSHFSNLMEIVFEQYSERYINMFLIKLVKYIDSKSLFIESVPFDELVMTQYFFSILKYVVQSFYFVAPEIRHIFNMIKSFMPVFKNRRDDLYCLISHLFLNGFLCSSLSDPSKYIPNSNVKNNDVFSSLIPFLKKVFSRGTFEGQYSIWNKRLASHIYPALQDFVFSLTDLIDDVPHYSLPSESLFVDSMNVIFEFLKFQGPVLCHSYASISEENQNSYLGLNFSSFLVSNYLFTLDIDYQDQLMHSQSLENINESKPKKRMKLVPVNGEGRKDGVVHRLVKKDPTNPIDPNKKFYKRIVKRVPKGIVTEQMVINKVMKKAGPEEHPGSKKVLKRILFRDGTSNKAPKLVMKVPKSEARSAIPRKQIIRVASPVPIVSTPPNTP